MKSVLKFFGGVLAGVAFGALGMHCMHLKAENDSLTDILDHVTADDDCDGLGLCGDACCGGCDTSFGECASACEGCDAKDDCPCAGGAEPESGESAEAASEADASADSENA